MRVTAMSYPAYSPYQRPRLQSSSAVVSVPFSTDPPGVMSDETLLKRYQPVLLMHPADVPPVAFEDLLRFSTLKQYVSPEHSIPLVQKPTLETLQRFNAPHFFLSFSPKVVKQAMSHHVIKPVIYGKAIDTPHFKVLYYFYYFPCSGVSFEAMSKKVPAWLQYPLMVHEGDAEGVQVFLQKPDLKPVGLFSFQHYAGKSILWRDIKNFQNRPIVQLELFSHASHPLSPEERVSKNQPVLPELRVIRPNNEIILSWQGRIGNFRQSPVLNTLKETLPSVTAGYRGPVPEKVTPWEVSLRLNASQQPEQVFYRYLPL